MPIARLRERLYNVVVPWVFERVFRAYEFPFEKSDEKIGLMKLVERTEYFRQAKDLLDNRVYEQEIKELIRLYYQEMACKTPTPLEMHSYRLTLKALTDFDRRIRGLALQYVPPVVASAAESL